ncbi:MAG TPA: hypothetical protein VFZ66_28285 [Herpetosiphonaceae bacterium]
MALQTRKNRAGRLIFAIVALLTIIATAGAVQAAPQAQRLKPKPTFAKEAAFDKTATLREMAQRPRQPVVPRELPEERGPVVADRGHSGDGALEAGAEAAVQAAQIPAPLITFEGLRNTDNPFLVNPPDPVGDVGPNHYVEMVNLSFAVYSKTGTRLLGPLPLGVLWDDFAVSDCEDLSGDPIVIYDQLADRWILSQFTTLGPTFYNCVAISQTGDPTGAYYRYAFSSGVNFPDYPKYGVWNNSYLLTTREFGPVDEYGIGVYALERNKMINGEPNVRTASFFLDAEVVPISLIGDGLLPPDIDGTRRPLDHVAAPIVGTQDDDHPYGATFDALNIWNLLVRWNSTPSASLELVSQIPVAEFDSIFPCAPSSRDCIPQPGITNPAQYIDILSYRQRPTWRLAYRNFGTYEALVTNQSVEARPGIAGVRWYELRRAGGQYSLYQQGTFAPDDGVHRWMGSIAMDKRGNMGLGYSVSSSTVYPGIRYTGRLRGDALGAMPLGEAVLINGSGSQLTTNSRWGDYTSMNIDPTDDCTFWYVNEYYETTSLAGWQTRIGSFKLPGCQ